MEGTYPAHPFLVVAIEVTEVAEAAKISLGREVPNTGKVRQALTLHGKGRRKVIKRKVVLHGGTKLIFIPHEPCTYV